MARFTHRSSLVIRLSAPTFALALCIPMLTGMPKEAHGSAAPTRLDKTAFLTELSAQYDVLATNERNRAINILAKRFARKAEAARDGFHVNVERLADWPVADLFVSEIDNASAMVSALIRSRAVEVAPALSAAAQVRFDCWIARASMGDLRGAETCKNDYESAVAYIRKRHYSALADILDPAPAYETSAQSLPPAPITAPSTPVAIAGIDAPKDIASSGTQVAGTRAAPAGTDPTLPAAPAKPASSGQTEPSSSRRVPSDVGGPIQIAPAPDPAFDKNERPQPDLSVPETQPAVADPDPSPSTSVRPETAGGPTSGDSPASGAARTPERPVEIPQKTWVAQEGRTVQETLEQWATTAGWSIRWKSSWHYTLEASAIMKGDFLDAVEQLLDAFEQADPPLEGVTYENKVLLIQNPPDRVF